MLIIDMNITDSTIYACILFCVSNKGDIVFMHIFDFSSYILYHHCWVNEIRINNQDNKAVTASDACRKITTQEDWIKYTYNKFFTR